MIFSTGTRINDRPKSVSETEFEFLDRSASPWVAKVRDLISVALNAYPSEGTAELIERMKSRDSHGFHSAAFELFVHEILRRRGFRLQTHPKLPTKETRPDFLVQGPTGQSFYLEAAIASSKDGSSSSAEAMKKSAIEELNKSPHNAFRIMLDSYGDPTTQPGSRKFVGEVHAWLNSLDADGLRKQLETEGLSEMPQKEWTHEKWNLTLTAVPIQPSLRGTVRGLVSGLMPEARWMDDRLPLFKKITQKNAHYGDLDRPLVVAVNMQAPGLETIDERDSLFGQEVWEERPHEPGSSGRWVRRPNGAFIRPEGYGCCRVSAAWIFADLSPYTIANRRSTVYLHPAPHFPVPDSLLAFPHARVEAARLRYADGLSIREVLGLTDKWPLD
ncbi:MAG: hypothetical protein KJZ84_14480 [Bryobacteraceae bacterium]|nr:hypothetical protein [Bryobacteraceae bacterium]